MWRLFPNDCPLLASELSASSSIMSDSDGDHRGPVAGVPLGILAASPEKDDEACGSQEHMQGSVQTAPIVPSHPGA